MLNAQQHFLDYLKDHAAVLNERQMDTAQVTHLQKALRQGELFVPIVGGFSVGKTTLINSFLGSHVLMTSITPETALATELHYSPNEEYIEAVISEEEPPKRFALSDIEQLKTRAEEFQYARVYLNNERLKAIYPLILVDMPGFSAPLPMHQKAIKQYLERGDYFLCLFAADEGGLGTTIQNEIAQLYQFSSHLGFGLTKTNLRSLESVQAVKVFIEENLKNRFDIDTELALFDDQGGDNLNALLSSINPETLFRDQYGSDLMVFHNETLRTLNAEKSVLENSPNETQKNIETLQCQIQELTETQAQEVERLNGQIPHQIDCTLNQVKYALSSAKPQIVDTLLQGGNPEALLERTVTQSCQNTVGAFLKQEELISVQHFAHQLERASLSNLDISNLAPDVSSLMESGKNLLTRLKEGEETLRKGAETAGKLYRGISTVFSVATNILAPVVELVLIFLPEIVAFFTASSREQRQKLELEQKLDTEVFPEILEQLRARLPEMLKHSVTELCQSIATQFEAQLTPLKATLESAEQNYAEQETERDALIQSLNEHIQRLQDSANTHLLITE